MDRKKENGMSTFLRAILNEWKQHLWSLLFLFVAEVLLVLVWIFITKYLQNEYATHYDEFYLLTMMILYCGIPVVMAPNLLMDSAGQDNSDKHLASSGQGRLYWIKFVAGLILFIFPIFALFAIGWIHAGVPSDSIYYENTIIILSVAVGIYVLFFFIASMMPKTRRPIALGVAILATLLLLFLLAPGMMSGIALLGNDLLIQYVIEKVTKFSYKGYYEGTPGYLAGLAGMSFLSLGIILLPPLGYLLWTRKIIRGEKYLKSLLACIGLLVLISIVLWIIAVTAGQSGLRQAERDAAAAGILCEPEQLLAKLPPVQEERNAANLYYSAYKMLNRFNAQNTDLYWHALASLQPKEASTESRQHLIDLVQSPESKQIYAMLEQAASYPECRFVPKIEQRQIKLFEFEMNHLAEFILARACVFKLNGQDDKILPEIEKSLKLAQIINNEQFHYSFIRKRFIVEDTITEAVKIGPDNPPFAASYCRMLDYLNQHPINYISADMEPEYNYFSTLLKLQCRFDEGKLRSCEDNYLYKMLLWNDLLAGYPLVARYFAYHINNSVKVRHEMLKIREMPVLPPELHRFVDNYYPRGYNLLLSFDLRNLFNTRSSQAMLKIGLALKIYKCEHGEYPASLQELVPVILPEIPADPLDGKAFGYSVKNDNFTLTRNSEWKRELKSKP